MKLARRAAGKSGLEDDLHPLSDETFVERQQAVDQRRFVFRGRERAVVPRGIRTYRMPTPDASRMACRSVSRVSRVALSARKVCMKQVAGERMDAYAMLRGELPDPLAAAIGHQWVFGHNLSWSSVPPPEPDAQALGDWKLDFPISPGRP